MCGCLFLMLFLFNLSNNPCASDEIEFDSKVKMNVDTLKVLQTLFVQQMTNLNLSARCFLSKTVKVLEIRHIKSMLDVSCLKVTQSNNVSEGRHHLRFV